MFLGLMHSAKVLILSVAEKHLPVYVTVASNAYTL